MEEQKICDQKAGDVQCPEAAVFTYTWDWGQHGVCCPRHQVILNQTAGNLQRGVQFVALQKTADVPLQRSERAALMGEVYALEMEAKDLKTRGAELYVQNTKLTSQLQALSVRHRETEMQLRDLSLEADKLRTKLDERDAEFGAMHDELDRLRSMVKFTDSDTARVDGLENQPQ